MPDAGALHHLSDTIPPTITCPANVTLTVSGSNCDTLYQYAVAAEDDAPGVVVAMVSGIAPGEAFPVGSTTTNLFIAVDAAGNTATCSFTVQAVNDPAAFIIECREVFTLYLDHTCSGTVTPGDLLVGDQGCLDGFQLDTFMSTGISESLTFGAAYIGSYIDVMIVRQFFGGVCFSRVVIQDTLPPVLTCPTLHLPCVLPIAHASPHFLTDSLGIAEGNPDVYENCVGNVTRTFADVVDSHPCDTSGQVVATISRTWSAADVRGNTTACVQTINLVRALAAVQFPEDVLVYCTAPDTAPADTGWPFVEVGEKRYDLPTEQPCQYDAQYSDSIETTCGGGWRIRRLWQVRDVCLPAGPDNLLEGTQYIEVRDTAGPMVQCPADTVLILSAAGTCSLDVFLPDARSADDCSPVVTAVASWSANGVLTTHSGTLHPVAGNDPEVLAMFGTVPDFPTGTTDVQYALTDACGNVRTCTFRIAVWDNEPPAAVCHPLLTVYLDNTGQIALPAAAADNGSADLCNAVYVKVRRTMPASPNCDADTSDFQDDLTICCTDVGGVVSAVLRVYDVPPPPGAVSDTFAAGQFADCSFSVSVLDTLGPVCVSPPDVTIPCLSFDPNLDLYGAFAYSCLVDSAVFATDYSQFDTLCRTGLILRHLYLLDAVGLPSDSCSQRIVSDAIPQSYYVRFPDDRIVTQCNGANQYGEPQLFFSGCAQIDVSYADVRESSVPDACYYIRRTWTVRNRCAADTTQPLVAVPNPNPSPVTNHPTNLYGPIVSAPDAATSWAPTVAAITPGSTPVDFSTFWSADASGYTYLQIIKVVDVTKPEVFDCSATPILFSDTSANDPFFWNAPIWQDAQSGLNDLCEGAVDLCITTTDLCANAAVSIRCHLFLDLNNDGVQETAINPSTGLHLNIRYNNAQTPPFSGGTSRQFDVRPVPPDSRYGFMLHTYSDGPNKIGCIRWRTFSEPANLVLPQLPYGTHRIRWFVQDDCGNETICEYEFTIQNDAGLCDGSGMTVSGTIRTELGAGIADVEVTANRTMPNQTPFVATSHTDLNGHYAVPILSGGDHAVSPARNSDPLNGVSTLDLLLINKHILGIDTLDSPYKMVAADVNNSRSITTFDIIELRKLILGIYTVLPANTAWRFVDAAYAFPQPNPFAVPFPEVRSGNNASPLNPPVHDFVGIKIGDVNNSAALADGHAEERTTGTVWLDVPGHALRAGETVNVPVSLSEIVSGVQVAISLTGLEVLEVLPGPGMGAEHFALFPDEGLLAVSWTGDGAPAFSLRLRANTAGRLSEMLRLANRRNIRPEAYRPDGNAYRTSAVALRFDGSAVRPPGIELFQNRPNPFGAATEIGFYLPEATTATLRVFDATGRERYAHTAPRSGGMHAVVLTRALLGEASGVLYYVLETDRERVVKKMVAE